MTRLDKLLADSGTVSRSQARDLVRSGRVTVNGVLARCTAEKYEAETVTVRVDGEVLNCSAKRYLMLYKPAGVLSATEDARQPTVLDLLPPQLRRQGLFPVGRLDKDTTGLLLLSNDGGFAHRVISPKQGIPKVYYATVEGSLCAEDVLAFSAGLTLGDGTVCLPAKLEILEPDYARVTVFEGKYHQVKRMFAACGKHVTALHRSAVGGLELDGRLPPGAFRELTSEELSLVFVCHDENML